MTRKLILPLVVIFFTNMIFAQAPAIQWQKSLGGSQDDIATAVQQTSDGGYIVAGHPFSNNGDVTGNHGSTDFWIVKLNAAGAIQWQKSLGGSNYDVPYMIRQTSDGGYIVAGYSQSTNGDVTGNHGNQDYWIVKLNLAGAIEWQKSLGGSSAESASDIKETSDGGYIIAGSSRSNNGDVTGHHGVENYDYWIVKLNSAGTIQWQKSLGGSSGDSASAIQETSDGGYIVSGFSQSTDGDVTGNHGSGDSWIVKLNAVGTIQWQKSLGGTGFDAASSIQQTSDGGYIVSGYSQSADGDVTGNHVSADFWIVKLNTAGSIQWQKSLGGTGFDAASSIQQTSDGGYIVSGYSQSTDGDVTGNHGSTDFWVIKLNAVGTIQWQKSLGGSSDDMASNIQETSDRGYIIAGQTRSNDGDVTGNHGNRYLDCWVVKLEPDKLNINEIASKNTVVVQNPVKDLLKIQSKEKITSLQLYSVDGKLIKTSNSQNMSVKDLPKGIYILKMQLENAEVISEKVIKE